MSKTIGIIGGMGPLAGIDLMQKIILKTPAETDQQHLHIVMDSNPKIPDRSAAILGKGPDPTPHIIASAQRLEQAGADLIVMACHTAHYFLPDIEASISVPMLNMLTETVQHVRKHLRLSRLGLLSSMGARRARLFQPSFEAVGIQLLEPTGSGQETVKQGIYAVKSGDLATAAHCFKQVSVELMDAGAEAVLAGCTEVPPVLSSSPGLLVIDPTEILAKAVVRVALDDEDPIER